MSDTAAVELIGIEKRFPGVIANRDVNISVRPQTIHAIIGENGAGKSTLMKTLYGMHRPEKGQVIVDGVEQHFRSPSDAIDVGIGMVHQHFMLADNFTVLENIILGAEPTHGAALNLKAAHASGSRRSRRRPASRSISTPSCRSSGSVSVNGSRSSRCCSAAPRSSSSTSRPQCWSRRKSTSCSSTSTSSSPTAPR